MDSTIFIGTTRDERFHDLDTRDGELLRETGLPAVSYATPITYAVDRRGYVAIAGGGGKIGTKSGDAAVALAQGECPTWHCSTVRPRRCSRVC